jgi:hypothetical protein
LVPLPRIVRDLLINANVRLDVKTDSVPDETLLIGPRLPLPVAVCLPKEVAGREVVTLINGQKGDRNDRDALVVEPVHHPSALRGEGGERQRDPAVERSKADDDRPVGEQTLKPGTGRPA